MYRNSLTVSYIVLTGMEDHTILQVECSRPILFCRRLSCNHNDTYHVKAVEMLPRHANDWCGTSKLHYWARGI